MYKYSTLHKGDSDDDDDDENELQLGFRLVAVVNLYVTQLY
jgi:hypothetical protein